MPRLLRTPARKLLARALPRDKATARPLQVAALPWRRSAAGEVEILLVTARGSGRWLIPKGWPMPGRSGAEAAAREAVEEAGVEGTIAEPEIGRFEHLKTYPAVGRVRLTVVVFALRVERELGRWPEKGQRRRRWVSGALASALVKSPALADIIGRFCASAEARAAKRPAAGAGQ